MQEAKDRLEKEVRPTASLEDILEYLAFAIYKQGNLKRALLLTDELYKLSNICLNVSILFGKRTKLKRRKNFLF